jgi:hypothetical protein
LPVTKLDGSSPIREPENLPILSTGGSSSTGCSSPPVIHWEPTSLLSSLHSKKSDQPISSEADPADPLAAAAAAIRAHPLLMTPQGLALHQYVQQLLRDQLIHPQVFSMKCNKSYQQPRQWTKCLYISHPSYRVCCLTRRNSKKNWRTSVVNSWRRLAEQKFFRSGSDETKRHLTVSSLFTLKRAGV